jgi:hypothetical protein
MTYQYQIHNGQVVPTAPYSGGHKSNLKVELKLDEMKSGNTNITVSIQNTMDGQTYHIHAHDSADPSSTPNATPYIETPNGDIFVQSLMGNGGSVSVTQESIVSFDELITDYEGFFVIHDPLQAISTIDISTFLVVGSFARNQTIDTYATATYEYDFNTGQVASAFAYSGLHESDLSATITVDELTEDRSRVTIQLINTMNGETYHTHAHDVADPDNTPNGTPYDESPNGNVFVAAILGNGGISSHTEISSLGYGELTTNYEGFFVVHDPLQSVSTVDPTTYVLLGSFAR